MHNEPHSFTMVETEKQRDMNDEYALLSNAVDL